MFSIRRRAYALAFVATFLGLACGGPAMNPKAPVARTALETALDAWRAGKKPGDLAQADPPIQAVDNEWTNGRKLASFEILGEEPSESDKRFKVKLTYAAPAPTAGAEVVYVVLGVSPVAVFREEDYARTLNMEDNPSSKSKAKKRR
jgi:hypothetical protein